MKSFFTVLAAVFAVSTVGHAQGVLTKTSDVKGYGKRDRVQFESDQTVMPSQLHEIYGARVEAGASVRKSLIKNENDTKNVSAPIGLVNAYYGGDNLVLGIGASHQESKSDAFDKSFREFQKTQKGIAQAAFTVANNYTLGAETVGDWVDFSQNSNAVNDREFATFFHRETVSFSYHDPRKEFGLAYTTGVAKTLGTDDTNNNATGFGLTLPETAGERSVYAPSHYTAFARGNFTNNWSGLASVSHVQYDENVEEASAAFADYKTDDRIAGSAQAVYWLDSRRSSVSLTGVYEGATYVPADLETDAYGYKLANRYGANLTAIASIGGRKYVGLMAGYLRGERDETKNNIQYKSSEEQTQLAPSLSLSF